MQASGAVKLSTPVSTDSYSCMHNNYNIIIMHSHLYVTCDYLSVRNLKGSLTGNMTSPEPLPLTPTCTTVLKVRSEYNMSVLVFVHVYAYMCVYYKCVCVCVCVCLQLPGKLRMRGSLMIGGHEQTNQLLIGVHLTMHLVHPN